MTWTLNLSGDIDAADADLAAIEAAIRSAAGAAIHAIRRTGATATGSLDLPSSSHGADELVTTAAEAGSVLPPNPADVVTTGNAGKPARDAGPERAAPAVPPPAEVQPGADAQHGDAAGA